jgi:AmmeMemoRadiSam system protein B
MNHRTSSLILSLILLVLPLTASSDSAIRRAAVDGSFYPRDPEELASLIKNYLGAASSPARSANIIGMIVPHAGYVYSGQVAAYAYRTIIGRDFDTVVLMGPSHRARFHGASAGDFTAYETPLGKVEVDKLFVGKLIEENADIGFHPEAHAEEHCIEVQLPFLKSVLEDFKIVPILFGDRSVETCQSVARSLLNAADGNNVLFIASSDLSHFHSYRKATKMDHAAIDGILALRGGAFLQEVNSGTYELCGASAVATLMIMAGTRGEVESKLLYYANSGDTPQGSRSSVVGYAAVIFTHKVKQ